MPDDTISVRSLTETPVKISPLISRSVQIRLVNDADYKILAGIERRCVVSGGQWGDATFRTYLKAANAIGFVAFTNNAFVGFLLASRQASFIELDYIAVLPEFQRHGIGTRLVVKAMNCLAPCVSHKDGDPKNNSLSNLRISAAEYRLTATVHEKNVAAQLFLRSVGFTAVNYFCGVREDGCDAVGFSLKLP